MSSAPVVFAVDDQENDVELFRLIFRKAAIPHPLQCYFSGEAIIQALGNSSPTHPVACFLDIKMPGMTGLDVLRWIRARRELDRMPIIMLTSSTYPEDLATAKSLGAQCYLEKFPRPEILQKVVDMSLRFPTDPTSFALPENLLRSPPPTD